MLIDVYRNLKTRIGFKDSERPVIIDNINDAWREIYDSVDLPESMSEIIADINVTSQVITLPFFVENIRKIRWYDPRLPLTMDNPSNRYHEDRGNELWIRKWRKVKREALARTLENYTQLTVSIPLAEPTEFKITITGQTTNSAYTYETLTFAPGELTKTTVADFIDVKSIGKDGPTTYDITIADGDGVELAVIPNHLPTFKYLSIQILDQVSSAMQQNFSSVEIFYKKAFHPVENDHDEFLFGNKYDMAVQWKFLEQNNNDPNNAGAAQKKCTDILNQIIQNEEMGMRTKIDFKANPYYNMPFRATYRRIS